MANPNQELWAEEYSQKGIPSSFRDNPSESVVYFLDFIRNKGVNKGKVIDIGSGKGRNSIFMAQQSFNVYSMDFVPDIIKELEKRSRELGLSDRIHTYCSSVVEKWAFPDNYFDLAVDTFCYTHQITKNDKEIYRTELARVMKPNGLYLLTLAGIDDGYYGQFLKSSPNPKEKIITDPVNSIPMVLYEKKEVESEFAMNFKLIDYLNKKHRNSMHGKEYNRSTHLFIFQKK